MARKELNSWLKSLAFAVILALIVRNYVLAFYVVDGNSMLPTLENGQMVAVNKLVYRMNSPRHGDVVVFLKEGVPGSIRDRIFIKRVIALPGDTVEIQDGKVILNGKPLEEDYIEVEADRGLAPQVIQEETLFVMGDNRHPRASWDSREFGPIPMDTVLGRAEVVVFPSPGLVD